jgi:DNA-binding NtrC family response regulator
MEIAEQLELVKGGEMNSTVLLVVEDPFFLQNLSESLKPLKALVVTAGNKHEALEVCANHEVDLALLDIRQQGNDAMQVLARLKKNQPETEVILLSDPENVALAMEGMRQGASDEITFPFDIDSFKKTIKSALRRIKVHRKVCRERTLLNVFEDTMMAATFAEAGEFETAQDIYKGDGTIENIG